MTKRSYSVYGKPPQVRTYGNHVYAVSDGRGAIKVGFAKDLRKRFYQLCREYSMRHRMRVVFVARCGVDANGDPRARSVEGRAHDLLSAKRIKGEWFRVNDTEATDAIIAAAAIEQTTLTPIEVLAI